MRYGLIMLLALASQWNWADSRVDALFQQAGQAFKQQEYDQAIKLLEEAKTLPSTQAQTAKVDNALGWVYFSQGDNQTAREYLHQAFKAAKAEGDDRLVQKISNNLGLLEYSANDLGQSKKYFANRYSTASQTASQYIPLINKREKSQQVADFISEGVEFRFDKDFESAVQAYDKALAIQPNNIKALEYKGYALVRLSKPAEAIEVLNTAYGVDPNKTNIVINLAKAYCTAGRFEDTKTLLTEHQGLNDTQLKVIKSDAELAKQCADGFDISSLQ